MSKEEFLKIQTCVLKVNIHCDGCKRKVKKILQKIDGVYTTTIDSEQGKVTVSGNVDPATVIKKLTKNGKYAELWGAPKANNNNQNQLNNQFKNIQIEHGKGGNNKGQGQAQGQGQKGGNNQPKGGQQVPNQQLHQLQQLQQLKGFQDLKLPPQFKDMKMPFSKDPNQKAVKFNLPEEDDISDDEFDDYDDDDDYEDDDLDDDLDDAPLNKMKPPMMGNGQGGGGQMPPNMMLSGMMNGQHPQLMKPVQLPPHLMKGPPPGGNNGGNGGQNGKKGGGNIPVQMNGMGGNNANGGKKGGGGNNNGGNQNQGGGAGKNGGGQPAVGKNGGGGGPNKNGNNGGGGAPRDNNINGNGGKKVVMNDGVHVMPNMMGMSSGGGSVGQMGSMPVGHMPMGQMGNMPAVQGLPAAAVNAGGPGGYFQGAGPEVMAGNPYYQQQLAAMMMNQQRANGNERFHPMMYARPPPAVNYVPSPYPYHPYQQPQPDPYTNYFNDENTSSCSIM